MSLSSLNSIGQSVFELQSGNKVVDKRTKNGQTNRWNYTNLEKNLAIMVIYLPVKFEFDWSNCFRVKSPKNDGQAHGITPISKGSCDGDLCPCQV